MTSPRRSLLRNVSPVSFMSAAIALLGFATVADAQVTMTLPINKCLAAKIAGVGKSVAARTNCFAKEAMQGAGDSACHQKASDKFTGGAQPTKGVFSKLDAKYPLLDAMPCLTFDDQAAFESAITAYVATVPVATGTGLGKCDAAKIKCVGKYVGALSKCAAKAAAKTGTVDGACVATAGAKLANGTKGCLDKAAAANDCTAPGNQTSALQGPADAFVRNTLCSLAPEACGECDAPTQCPGVDADCQIRTCTDHVCGVAFTPSGAPTSGQSPDDCRQNQCDGAGAIVSAVDDTDVPVDGNQCTADVCSAGVPSHSNEPLNKACDQDGGTACNGLGACVIPPDAAPVVTVGGPLTISEASLADGTTPDTAALTSPSFEISVTASDGLTFVTVEGVAIAGSTIPGFFVPIDVPTPRGVLSVASFSGDVYGGSFVCSYTLHDNALASGGASIEEVGVAAQDANGTTASDDVSVEILDDAPVLDVEDGEVQNSTNATAEGSIATIGADAEGAHVVLSLVSMPAGLSASATPLTYTISADGSVITATQGPLGPTAFTLTGLPDGSYAYHQTAFFDLSVLTTDLQPTVGPGGPQAAYYLYADGQFGSVENAKDWDVAITGNGLINPTTQGMGVGNNIFSTGETMHFEFDDEDASSTGYEPNLVYVVKVGVVGLDAGETLTYTAHYTNGTNSGQTTVGPSDLIGGILTVKAPGGGDLDSIDLAAGPTATSVRLNAFSAFTRDDGAPKTLSFGATATDGDGDAVSGSFSVTVSSFYFPID